MAPNLVKSASLCSLDLSSHMSAFNLQDAPARYAPLTGAVLLAPQSAKQATTENPVFGSKGMRRSPSVLFKVMVEEEARSAVSCAHIETNLIADANRQEDPNKRYIVNENKQEEESYWDMPSDCDTVDNKFLSANQVERLLVEDAIRRAVEVKQQKSMVVNKHPNNSYWEWPSQPVTESDKKSSLIAAIILEESIRQELSIDNITNLETSNKLDSNTESQAESASISTDYWCWNNEEQKEEIVAPHVHDSTHPNHAYWNFPNESSDPQDLKKNLIDKILNDERIRNILSADTVQEREINFHRSKQQYAKANHVVSDSSSDTMPPNYWDFNTSTEGDLLSLLSTEKQELINRILKEEQQRYIVSTENIEKNLFSSTSDNRQMQEASGSSSSYWDW